MHGSGLRRQYGYREPQPQQPHRCPADRRRHPARHRRVRLFALGEPPLVGALPLPDRPGGRRHGARSGALDHPSRPAARAAEPRHPRDRRREPRAPTPRPQRGDSSGGVSDRARADRRGRHRHHRHGLGPRLRGDRRGPPPRRQPRPDRGDTRGADARRVARPAHPRGDQLPASRLPAARRYRRSTARPQATGGKPQVLLHDTTPAERDAARHGRGPRSAPLHPARALGARPPDCAGLPHGAQGAPSPDQPALPVQHDQHDRQPHSHRRPPRPRPAARIRRLLQAHP